MLTYICRFVLFLSLSLSLLFIFFESNKRNKFIGNYKVQVLIFTTKLPFSIHRRFKCQSDWNRGEREREKKKEKERKNCGKLSTHFGWQIISHRVTLNNLGRHFPRPSTTFGSLVYLNMLRCKKKKRYRSIKTRLTFTPLSRSPPFIKLCNPRSQASLAPILTI